MDSLLLLGRPVLQVGGRPLAITVRKSWALLALLAVGGAAPRSRVVALLWPQLDESSARRNLRRELARLAEVGATGVVQADGDFLALAPTLQTDLRQFEAACAAGRFDAALPLWRGALADGLQLDDAAPFDDWLAPERERLRSLWRQALEAAAQAAADAATPEQAAAHWHTLLADDPLQERHHRALIRLHLASGRREAALAQYERCRTLLADELGLAPMAETDALVAAVRAAAPATAPRLQLPGQLPFVGREAEVRALEAAWTAGRLLWIEGEGGVGKTRLATDFCAAHGAYALARCRPGDLGVPYAAFTRALRVLAADALAAADLPPWVAAELARVLPELGAQPRAMASSEEQTRFFEACVQAWQRLGDDSFDAVVIDDWHQADAPSQALLAFIVPRLADSSARLLLLSRPLQPRPALAEQAALQLVLAPLHDDAVADLVRQLSRVGSPTRFADRLRRATGGNPFFIAETLRHLAETGALRSNVHGRWATPFDDATEDYRELPLPATVRDAVLARVQRLPDAPRRLLEAASLAAEPFAPALLAAACALSEMEALAAIELALAASLLREHERGGYAFGHDLAQQALEAALSPERRRLVHRRLALAAEATRAAPGLVALHFEAGGEPARAVVFRLAAGDEAQALFVGAQALQHWQAALALQPTPGQAVLLHLRCARALMDTGNGSAALAQLTQVDALLADGVLTDGERSDAQIACADIESTLNRAVAALPRIESLLARPDGSLGHAARARALRVHCHALQHMGRLDEAQASAQAALALWPDDPLERAALLEMLQIIEYQRGHVSAALALTRQAQTLWLAHGDRRSIARSHYRIGVLLLVAGDAEGGKVELERVRAMASEMHLVELERDAILNLIKVEADRGDAERMLALAAEGWNLSPTFARPRIRQILLQAQCHAHGLLGDLGRCLALSEQFLAESAANAEPVARQYAVLTVLDLLVYLGDFERGRALLREVAASGAGQLAYLGVKLSFCMAFLELRAGNTAAARAALAGVGDPAALEQPQDRCSFAVRLAELSLAEGRPEAALEALEPWRGELPNVELQTLVWAARLQAQQALGQVSACDWHEARAALDDGKMPPPDALELRRALWRSAPGAEEAAALGNGVRAATRQLADSLAAWPAHQARFLARNPL